MRHTYYWYYAAEARLPWSPSERHLIFSPPSSLSMGPSVVENEFSLICMTDKHILYLSHRRSYAMDLGTWERKRVRGWNDAWSYLCEWSKWGGCVCLSVYQSSDVCMCLHNLRTCNVYVCPLAMPLFLCWWFQIYISMPLCVCVFSCNYDCMCDCIFSHQLTYVCANICCRNSFSAQNKAGFWR